MADALQTSSGVVYAPNTGTAACYEAAFTWTLVDAATDIFYLTGAALIYTRIRRIEIVMVPAATPTAVNLAVNLWRRTAVATGATLATVTPSLRSVKVPGSAGATATAAASTTVTQCTVAAATVGAGGGTGHAGAPALGLICNITFDESAT